MRRRNRQGKRILIRPTRPPTGGLKISIIADRLQPGDTKLLGYIVRRQIESRRRGVPPSQFVGGDVLQMLAE